MGWGNKWEVPNQTAFVMTDKLIPLTPKELHKMVEQVWTGVDLAKPKTDQTVLTTFEDGKFKHRVIEPEGLYDVPPTFENLVKAYATVRNRKPTHDPYTNPNAHIYYECNCGAILDPQTKSFAQLNNYASDKGWKIRFTDKGYVPYCVKCGEGVE